MGNIFPPQLIGLYLEVLGAVLLMGLVSVLLNPRRRRRGRPSRYRSPAPAPGAIAALTERPMPYLVARSLCTDSERAFYYGLLGAAAGQWAVFPKVRLLDLLWLPERIPDRQAALNRVQSKHVDFVLCDPISLAPRLVVELDDRSHNRPDRQASDAVKDAVLAHVGLPVLRWPATSPYDPQAIAAAVHAHIGGPAASTAPRPQ